MNAIQRLITVAKVVGSINATLTDEAEAELASKDAKIAALQAVADAARNVLEANLDPRKRWIVDELDTMSDAITKYDALKGL